MPITVRGVQIVDWYPNYALTLVSDDGVTLTADGTLHNLTATLTSLATSQPVSGKKIRLGTIPLNRVGDLAQSTTTSRGTARFGISDTVQEIVNYRAYLLPQQIVTSSSLAIGWNMTPSPPGPPAIPPSPPLPPSPPSPPVPPGTPQETNLGAFQVSPPLGSVPAGSPIVWWIFGIRNYNPTPTYFPLVSGSSVQIFTDPPGGPSDGVTVSFGEQFAFGAVISMASVTSTSPVPGSWTYRVTGPTLPFVVYPSPNPAIVPGSGAPIVLTWT